MTPASRLLICDQLMVTTLPPSSSSQSLSSTDSIIPSAPSPLPANYGTAVRFSHQRDLCMMGIINGVERTPAQLISLVEGAGMRVVKVWEGRSQVPIVEVRLKE